MTTRLLIVLPSWLGDAVMSTPTLRAIRAARPGWFIGGLVRPGIDQVMEGSDLLDEIHVERASGVLGPKFVAARIRPRRYDIALLLTNSFSTALVTRIAGIPSRIGYDRDARGFLLTTRLKAPKSDGSWSVVPAVEYYWRAGQALLETDAPCAGHLELATTERDESLAAEIRSQVDGPYAILNPGGNNPAKRWPAERYIQLVDHLRDRGLRSLVNGSPAEQDLVQSICDETDAVDLPALGNTIGALKALTRDASLMVTNDTGPRHIAVAMATPVITLFGPTDHRWTTVPTRASEIIILADPTIGDAIANDDPERSRIDRIEFDRVRDAVDSILERPPITASDASDD